MRITEYSIRHRLTIYVLMALIVVAGAGAYVSLPLESFPEIKIPLILVTTAYSGVSPEDIETIITRPIETELKGITGVKEIRSSSSEGMSVIEVEFNPEVDLDTALQKVRDEVDIAKTEIPEEVDDPRIQDIDLSQIPILLVSLSGDIGLVKLKEIAEDLKDDLEAIQGVNRVQVIGGREREVHIFADPRRLSFYELSLTDLIIAVTRENLNVPGGDIDIGHLKYLVRLPAEIDDPREIEDFVVEVRNGQPIYVRDVARVVYGFEDEATRSRLDRKPSVTLTVEKRTGANIIEVSDWVKEELERQQQALPSGTNVTLVADMSKDIRTTVSELENNILSGLILVVVVLMAFLGFRNSVFVAVAIPLSMLLSFIVIQLMGYTLNMVVLFSLILVLGMLVDNAVVIVENIYRHRELGSDGPTAALEATKEVAVPVIASTITTLCAFTPLLLWPGIIGDFMSYLPVTLIIGLTASLVVALVFNPTLCAYFMKAPSEGQKRSQDEGAVLKRYRRLLAWTLEPGSDHGTRGWFWRNWSLLVAFVTFFSGGVGLILVAFFLEGRVPVLFTLAGALMGLGGAAFGLQGFLWLNWSWLRRLQGWSPYVTDRRSGVIYTMGAILAMTMYAYSLWGQGVELFPEMDPRQIFVDVEAPSGATLETSNDLVDRIEGLTTQTKDRRYTLANVGSSGMSLEDIGGGGSSVSNKSRVTLDLRDRIEREQKNTLTTMEEVRKSVGDVEGAEIKVNKPNHGPPTGKPVSIRVSGDDFHVLERLSREVQERIRSVPGLVNLDDDLNQGKPEIRVKVDRIEAALTGIHTRDIANTIQTAVRGSDVSEYRIGEDEYDIVVRLDPEYRATLEDLTDLTVPDEDGLPIPIRAVASLEPGLGPSSIRRVDLRRVVTIDGDVVRARGRTEDSVRQEVAGRLELIDWPEGYRWEFAGSNQDEAETTAFVERAFVIAVMLIMLVLVTQFDSLILPITIMVSVVLSLIGVLWGLILTQTPFGIIMTGIGVISLAGVVVNNAIVLCDFIRQLRERGYEKTKAVIEAGVIRLRPVFLTAVTTVLGLIPLTIGLNIDFFEGVIQTGVESSQWWGPMGVAVIFGLTVATVLTLVVVPVTYHSLDEMTGSLQSVTERFRSRRRREEVAAETEGATSLRSSS